MKLWHLDHAPVHVTMLHVTVKASIYLESHSHNVVKVRCHIAESTLRDNEQFTWYISQ